MTIAQLIHQLQSKIDEGAHPEAIVEITALYGATTREFEVGFDHERHIILINTDLCTG